MRHVTIFVGSIFISIVMLASDASYLKIKLHYTPTKLCLELPEGAQDCILEPTEDGLRICFMANGSSKKGTTTQTFTLFSRGRIEAKIAKRSRGQEHEWSSCMGQLPKIDVTNIMSRDNKFILFDYVNPLNDQDRIGVNRCKESFLPWECDLVENNEINQHHTLKNILGLLALSDKDTAE